MSGKEASKPKRPFYIKRSDGRPFGLAGLRERWEGPRVEPIESCTVITTDANEVLRTLHDRMPVILPEEAYEQWLDPNREEGAELCGLLRPFPPNRLTVYEVSPLVNSPRNDSPECIAPRRQLTLDLPPT